jgi:transposase
VSLVCDERGTPLAVEIGPGQEHDLIRLRSTLEAALRLGCPARVVADRAYSVVSVRSWLAERRIRPVIPTRKDQRREERFDARAYRHRNVVERLVGWLKESRRMATRYEKLAGTYLAVVKLAMIRRLMRVAFPDTA